MKNFYIAVIESVDSVYTIGSGYYAYIIKITTSDNIKTVFDRIGGLIVANICVTKKEAEELTEQWNEGFKKNGTYAF